MYWPNVIWVINERITVASSATDNDEFNISARVKIIEAIEPINHVAEAHFRKVRSFSPEVDSLPSSSRSKKAIASNEPTVAKALRSERNLKPTANKLIVQRIIYVRIVTIQRLRRQPELKEELQKHLFPSCYLPEFVVLKVVVLAQSEKCCLVPCT